MHVRGLHPSSELRLGEKTRGTFAGLIEKILYLQELAITAVELLPVFQFDAQDAPSGLVSYGGYAPVSFFAPHEGYSSRRDTLGAVDECRDMVKARTGPASRSFSTSCSTTPPKAIIAADALVPRTGGGSTRPTSGRRLSLAVLRVTSWLWIF
jgi:glycosidase